MTDGLGTFLLAIATALVSGCVHLPKSAAFSDPLSADEHLQLGASYERQGLHRDAAEQYHAAFSKNPKSVGASMLLGNQAFTDGDLRNAEHFYRHAISIAPEFGPANNNLAVLLVQKGEKLEEAEQRAQLALRSGESLLPYALDTLATIYIHQRRFGEAEQALVRAEAIRLLPPTVRNQLADTRKRLERVHLSVMK